MITSKIDYLGGLRTSATHLASGTTIITDAPVDNHGKGEAFSPTDLVATSYASCMLTIIGIYCQSHNLPFTHGNAEVTKIMSTDAPRRIEKLIITLDISKNDWDETQTKHVIAAGKACPVAKTLGDNVVVELNINA
jgi:putative redox protein